MKKRIKISLIILLALTLAIGVCFYNLGKRVEESYAAWNTTTAIAAYIVRNEGKLPEKWDDLIVLNDPHFGTAIINHYKEKIEVTFKSDSIDIQTISDREPFYNKPNEEIQQVIREFDLPENDRTSPYWHLYRPQSETKL